MKLELITPTLIITGMAIAGIVYFCTGDWKRGTYWAAAAVLNLVITLE